ncbi:hypothetical protein ALC56_02751 [Trachymyrmex septentrionalis]|uniref:Uncharacterized protein n=1 Tax=Trachymyrmex septentrionalis TaxID=34720 RepID=A0A195FRN3_9HYME|nr:hypothetical protein ALC56_02751 [Trachymyrmex septentrionalis]
MGLARRTFHGRRERPSGVALCHIQPRPPSAAPHSNNRHRRFEGWMRGKEDVGGSRVDGSGRSGGGGPTEGEFRPAEAHLDRLGLSKGGRGIPLPSLPPVAVLILSHSTLFLRRPPPIFLDSLTKAPNASGARIHVYVTLRARICGMARGCYGDPPSARG